MTADNIWKRINALENPYKSFVLACAWGTMQGRMNEKDLEIIENSLEYYEKAENKLTPTKGEG